MTGRAVRRAATAFALLRLTPAYLAFGILKHFVPLPKLARLSWRAPTCAGDSGDQRLAAARVARIRRLLHRGDADCLETSLLLYRELSRLGADPTLAFGFRRADGRLEGHAWVMVSNVPVGESLENLVEFAPACQFGRFGDVVAGDRR